MSKTLAEMISVMQAAQEGKAIQLKSSVHTGPWDDWCDVSTIDALYWNWREFNYRVKPETNNPRRVLISYGPNGDFKEGYWKNLPTVEQCIESGLVEFIELTPEIKAKLGL